MTKNPFPAAFTATFAALLFTISGALGYDVSWHGNGSFARWTGAPVMWEIWLGLAFAAGSVLAWRRVYRSL